jgi:hypothetical protein
MRFSPNSRPLGRKSKGLLHSQSATRMQDATAKLGWQRTLGGSAST